SGDINTIILDKTGTITHGNRMAAEFVPVGGARPDALNRAAAQSSIYDETPEGRSVIELATKQGLASSELELPGSDGVEFRAETRMSGTNLAGGTVIRKGAVD
ncbi:potassium-transporting ATPase subunit B, partial [Acinetobacter baumannii]